MYMLDLVGTPHCLFSHAKADILVYFHSISICHLLILLWLLDCQLYLGLFEFMLYIQVNSYGHVGTLPPFNGTFSQYTKNAFENYNHPNKQ